MKGFIFLVAILILWSAIPAKEEEITIIGVGKKKDILKANEDRDDILEHSKTQRSAIANVDYRWQSPVPYILDESLDLNAKGTILKAFDQFRVKSCIDFKPWDSERYFLSMVKLNGCFSYVGKVFEHGQNLSIGANCDSLSIVEHEVLHALGFYHEHSRYDRDDYVEIVFENIQSGKEDNFRKINQIDSTTSGVSYDYLSVMHYSKTAFSNGNGSTIITKDPAFQDVIGQTLEMSPSDVLELNRLYECKSSVAFLMGCSFSGGSPCEMSYCEDGNVAWTMVTQAYGGPSGDHTNLPNGNGNQAPDVGFFMHASTTAGKEGDSARLETKRLTPTRRCPVQCLQFYFCHLGNETDQLNIWVREFQGDWDQTGSLYFVDQITGNKVNLWNIRHVSLNATKSFQVVFEVRKGAGNSSGGFSIDDINLSETRCPDYTLQLDNFQRFFETSSLNTVIYSPRLYTTGGYAYTVGLWLQKPTFAVFVQLLSGVNDERLEWPCLRKQFTFKMLDQSSNIQQQMSKQGSFTSDLSKAPNTGLYLWGNPREVGSPFTTINNETIYGGLMLGFQYFSSLTEIRDREFVKGGSIVLTFTVDDLTPLVNGSELPCPGMPVLKISTPSQPVKTGPCLRPSSPATTSPRPMTTVSRPSPATTRPPLMTTDSSIFGAAPVLVASPLLLLIPPVMLFTQS